MKKTFALMLAIMMLLGLTCTASAYDEEILFQNVPWGTNEKKVRSLLIEAGFADPKVTSGHGSGAVFWPEDDSTLADGLNWLPNDLYSNKAGYLTRVKALKKVGGYEVDDVSLSYLANVKDGSFDPNDTQLVTVSLTIKASGIKEGLPIYADLLEKLEKQYGTMEKYANESRISREYDYNSFIQQTGKANVCYGMNYAYAFLYGQNNTALLLNLHQWGQVEIYYVKTDANQLVNELIEIVNAQKSTMEDAGL